jgi:hypothetical protein
MNKSDPSRAQQIARAALASEQLRAGHMPKSVAVVLGGDTLVVTLHGALWPAGKAWSRRLPREGRAMRETWR